VAASATEVDEPAAESRVVDAAEPPPSSEHAPRPSANAPAVNEAPWRNARRVVVERFGTIRVAS